jgi:NAD(P)H-dependent FMN reductase
MPDVSILGIPGSLRRASFNRMAIDAARGLVPEGATLEIFGLEDIPPFNQDVEKQPPARVVELKARVRAADGILFATPEYNYSVPGVLKMRVRRWPRVASRPRAATRGPRRGPAGRAGRLPATATGLRPS